MPTFNIYCMSLETVLFIYLYPYWYQLEPRYHHHHQPTAGLTPL